MTDSPERKSPTEALDLQRKTEDIVSGRRAVDELYPYIPPDYNIPFLHIGDGEAVVSRQFHPRSP